MPTMSKLVAAALLGALGYFVADLIGSHLPPEELQNWLRPMSAFFGVLVGWRYLGKNMRGDWSTAIGLGLSAGALVTLISLFWFSADEMVRRSLRKSYGGNPIEALEDVFAIAWDFTEYLRHPDVIVAAVGGSVLIGFIVTAVSRRWR